MFLGTAGSMPTGRRSPTALLLRRGGDRLLIDCAEGTQRQLMRSSVGLIELREVFLTHYHADHYLGLPGMLKTFALRGRDLPITIYGPRGLVDLFAALRRIFGKLTYHIQARRAAGRDARPRGYRIVTFRSTTACPHSATRSSRSRAPAASTSRRPIARRPRALSAAACNPARRSLWPTAAS